jgi:hypothetical protein
MVAKKRMTRMTKRKHVKRGGAVRMPHEYFGGDSARYFPAGDAKLTEGSSAYGQFVSVSQGVPSMDGQMVGPNMGPSPDSSCTQTGGRNKKRSSKKHSKKRSSKKSKKHTKKSKKHSKKRSSKKHSKKH